LRNLFKVVLLIPAGLVLAGISYSQGVATGNLPAAARAKASGLPWQARFADVAREAGLTAPFVQGHPTKKRYIVEANGTGVAFVDIDNDGLLDVFLVNGSRLEGSPATSHLYRNTGSGKFADVTVAAGMTRSGWGNGVCAGDVDNDGFTDLYVTYWGMNSLYRNNGGRSFEDIAAKAGVAGSKEQWSTGCAFVDYDRDGLLDLFVVTYVGFDAKTTPLPGQAPYCMYREKPVYCGPRGLPHGRATLYRNLGGGKFADVSLTSGVRKTEGFHGFTTVAADFNGDGWQDIYVASDSTPSLLFRNNRNGTFSEVGAESGVAYNENGTEQAGMGVAVADYNRDGWLDITKTNFSRDYPNLYRNQGKGFFEDLTMAAGLAVNPQYLLWGTGLEDLDNDGLRDVFQVGGHVYADIASIDPGESYATPRLTYRQLPGSGKFEDVSGVSGPGVAAKHASRGAAFGDFDNDGDIDVLVMNMDEPPSLLRNELKSANHWLGVKLTGTLSNRLGIGASVTVTYSGGVSDTGVVLSQSSYLSVNDLRLHFGLGRTAKVDRIVVKWPTGESEVFGEGGEVDRVLTLVEGKGRKP